MVLKAELKETLVIFGSALTKCASDILRCSILFCSALLRSALVCSGLVGSGLVCSGLR